MDSTNTVSDVDITQMDLNERRKHALKEVKEVLDKYQLSLRAVLTQTEDSLRATIAVVDNLPPKQALENQG